MDSVDKLREWTARISENPHLGELYDAGVLGLNAIADCIEREIERDYMELPKDADGVPIRIGDVLDPPKGSEEYGKLMVTELTYDGEDWYFKGEIPASFTGQAGYFNVIGFAHVKPRTLKDVLIEYRLKSYNLYADQELTGDERVDEFIKLDAEYDSEIREMFGGDAE